MFKKAPEKAKTIAKDLLGIWNESGVQLLPAHLAFFTVLSIVPVLIIVFFGAQYFSLPIEKVAEPLQEAIPDDITTILTPTEQNASNRTVGIWLVVALFVGSRGMKSVMLGSDSLYGFDTSNPLFKRLKAVLLTLLLVILVLVGVAIIGLSEYLLNIIPVNLQGLIAAARWTLVILLAFTGAKYLYMATPNQRIPSKYTNLGALIAVIGWVAACVIFSFYYTNFSNYTELYGALASIIALMILVYILVTIFVAGMIVNVYQYRQAGSPSKPKTPPEKVPESETS